MNRFELPPYPCVCDMWDELVSEVRPIVVYGMGNGADKLIERFEKYGIEIADFFASDGFVRGHSFHGKRVKSFSEIKAEYSEFVIVLSFASSRADVLDMLSAINDEYDMYVPDMPVAGVDEYFDRAFFNAHYAEILAAQDLLCDDESKRQFASIINYKLTGRMKYLSESYSDKSEMYSIFPCEKILSVVDAGAYNGDTIKEAKEYFPNLKKCIAIEPDSRNFKKLVKYCEAEKDIDCQTINAAAWGSDRLGEFFDSGNRNSTVSATASFEHRSKTVSLVRIDSVATPDVDYIKYDVEGAEREALIGSSDTISTCRPSMLISAYHRSRDVFDIVIGLADKYPFYNFYLRRLRCIPAWEINIIAIPKS